MMDSIINAAKERANRDLSMRREEQNTDKLQQVIRMQEYILQEIKEIKVQIMELRNRMH